MMILETIAIAWQKILILKPFRYMMVIMGTKQLIHKTYPSNFLADVLEHENARLDQERSTLQYAADVSICV